MLKISVLLVLSWNVLVVESSPLPLQSSVDPFNVPDVPKTLEESEFKNATLVDIWSSRLVQYREFGGVLRRGDPQRPEPATILLPDETKMDDLVPQEEGHPLYAEEFSKLTDNFLLDSLSTDPVNLDDPKFSWRGIYVSSLTEKDLLFRKDPKNSKITVNGIPVLKIKKIDKFLTVFVLDGILFNYEKQINDSKPF